MEKICTKCKIVKPFSEFHIDKKMKCGRRSACKKCCNKSHVEYKDRIRASIGKKKQLHFQGNPIQNGQKRCPKCCQWKPMTTEYFYRNKKYEYGGGFCVYCKDCAKALQKINIKKYAKKIAKLKKEWARKNKEHVKKQKREYFHKKYKWTHIGHLRAKQRRSYKRNFLKRWAYNKTHQEERSMVSVKWRQKNPEKFDAHKILNWAIRHGKITKPLKCSKCSREFENPRYINGHHEDYSKPLDVTWVCTQCHCDIHREKREKEEIRKHAEMIKLKKIKGIHIDSDNLLTSSTDNL